MCNTNVLPLFDICPAGLAESNTLNWATLSCVCLGSGRYNRWANTAGPGSHSWHSQGHAGHSEQ